VTLAIQQRLSPNHGVRPFGVAVDCIVLHADAAAAVGSSLEWCRDPASKVSYHYLIGRTGEIYQLVPDDRRAWHAGVSQFAGRKDVNDFSIGVSFGNRCDGLEPFPSAQITAGVALCLHLMRRWPSIRVDRITTHQAIALPPGRKHDPGPLFLLAGFLADVSSAL
jgi:N-acetyl-anhydromuramyl-L-alanine amidase AmpD